MEIPSYARQAYTEQLQELEHDLLEMGSRAETMIGQAVEALCNLDSNLARAVILRDDEIDERDLAIESRCIRLLALQQPMGSDLRVVSTAMKMITDIERVGDLAVDLAKIALKVEKEMGSSNCVDFPRIAGVARQMFCESLEAFVRRDLDRVQHVARMEFEVDRLYRELRTQVFRSMQDDPTQVVTDGWLLLALHHIERIADHAVNIVERVHYMVTGEFRQLAVPGTANPESR